MKLEIKMFLKNKYTRWYDCIINARQITPPQSDYVERHHIVPTSLGGPDTKENIVSLTCREHFICHHLLTKMVKERNRSKMAWALHRMTFSKTGDRQFTSRQYETARRIFSKLTTGVSKSNGPAISKALKGIPKSTAHRAAVSKAMRGFIFSKERNEKIRKAHFGRKRSPFTEEHKAAISRAAKKRAKPSAERNKKISQAHMGKPKSESHRQNIANALRGKPKSESHIRNSVKAKKFKRKKMFEVPAETFPRLYQS